MSAAEAIRPTGTITDFRCCHATGRKPISALTETTRLSSSQLTANCATNAITTRARSDSGVGAVERHDQQAGEAAADREHRRVVRHADHRPVVDQVRDHQRPDPDERADLPAEEHHGRDREDDAERDAARVVLVDRHRVALGDENDEEERRDADQTGRIARRRRELVARDDDDCEARSPDGREHREKASRKSPPRAHRFVSLRPSRLPLPAGPAPPEVGCKHGRCRQDHRKARIPLQHEFLRN